MSGEGALWKTKSPLSAKTFTCLSAARQTRQAEHTGQSPYHLRAHPVSSSGPCTVPVRQGKDKYDADGFVAMASESLDGGRRDVDGNS